MNKEVRKVVTQTPFLRQHRKLASERRPNENVELYQLKNVSHNMFVVNCEVKSELKMLCRVPIESSDLSAATTPCSPKHASSGFPVLQNTLKQ